jgi:23S rRNA pseudouridine1911/1915/1917 synthase
MQSLGHPLVGDPVYGKRRTADPVLADFSRQALHAERLAFIHPLTGEASEWQVPSPADLGSLLAALRAKSQP